MQKAISDSSSARLATLSELRQNVIPNFIQPVPCEATIRNWLDAAKVPRFKANPSAQKGGGPCYYSVPHVEKLFRRMLPGKLPAAA
jgi:hypothetical protein